MPRTALLLSVLTLVLAWGAPPSAGGEPRIANDLVVFLDHEDEVVRQEAARALLHYGFPAEDALAAAVREGDTSLAAAAGRVGRYFSLARQLREDSLLPQGPWLALEAARAEVEPALLADVLALGLDGPVKAREVLAARDHARNVALAFVRDWNEHYVEGSDEEKRYDALEARLLEAGSAAVPHLLRVLETDPRRAFLYTDPPPPGEISARMQVRAIFGVSFLEAREALPHLLIHVRGPSLTASTNAGAAFAKLAPLEGAEIAPFTQPDVKRLDAWWTEHRSEFTSTRRDLEHALFRELRTLLAHELLHVSPAPRTGQVQIRLPAEFVNRHHRQAWLMGLVARVSGVAQPTIFSTMPAEERLAAVQRYATQVALAQ